MGYCNDHDGSGTIDTVEDLKWVSANDHESMPIGLHLGPR